MSNHKFRCLLISDFNADVLKGYLSNLIKSPAIEVSTAPFGQVIPTLIDDHHPCWRTSHDATVLWTQPEKVVNSFQRALNYQPVSIEDILAEVDHYADAILNIKNKVNSVFIPTWVHPTFDRGHGLLDMKHNYGLANILMQMNLRLSEKLKEARNIYLLNTQKWVESSGQYAFSPKLMYMGKIPFGNPVFKEAAQEVRSALSALAGGTKKLIIVDLDDTLWGGTVGEVGYKNIRLGGHDPVGEAFVDFQKALKSLSRRGILLGIVSKNEESTALEAINHHPEMVFNENDFAGWKINWEDKAKNIVDLVSELNLSLSSVVFIDDHPVERARVREALPEVFVPDWPADKMLYAKTLLSLSCFDRPSLSQEDTKRTEMYVTERMRREIKANMSSLDEWIKNLALKVDVQELDDVNLPRTAQLLNKTNQMNLTTRRMTEPELKKWAGEDNHKLWTFRVSDKFGDSGLTGIISLEVDGKKGKIVDFVLSCRVIGRKVEEVMVYTLLEYARSLRLAELSAEYLKTEKNNPCLQFWLKSSFRHNEEKNLFVWDMPDTYPKPEGVEIKNKTSDAANVS